MSAATSRYELFPPPAAAEGQGGGLQRGDGAVEIAFARRGPTTAMSRVYQRTPCRVHFPHAEAGQPALAMLLNTAGGLTGGDRIALGVMADSASSVTVTSAAAEKIYRSLGADCSVEVTLDVAEGAWLEWLPQETILFDQARLRRRLTARVAATGRLLAAEMLVFGRVARGERWRQGLLREQWRLSRAGDFAWYDSTRLEGDAIDNAAGLAGAEAMATAIYVGADASRHLDLARAATGALPCRAGATLVNGILLARFIGAAVAVRAALGHYVGALRHEAAGLTPSMPRAWSI